MTSITGRAGVGEHVRGIGGEVGRSRSIGLGGKLALTVNSWYFLAIPVE